MKKRTYYLASTLLAVLMFIFIFINGRIDGWNTTVPTQYSVIFSIISLNSIVAIIFMIRDIIYSKF